MQAENTASAVNPWEAAYLRFETPQEEVRKFISRLNRIGASQWPRDARIAELFCGRGNGLRALATLGFTNLEGVDLSAARARRRVFCRPCVDWTERRPHIGGAVGAALANRCFELKWIDRMRDSRALTITPAGHRGLMETFALSI